jgi:hypothetical protein
MSGVKYAFFSKKALEYLWGGGSVVYHVTLVDGTDVYATHLSDANDIVKPDDVKFVGKISSCRIASVYELCIAFPHLNDIHREPTVRSDDTLRKAYGMI